MFNTMIYDYGGVMLFVQIYFSIKVLKYSSFLVGWWDWDCSLKMVYYSYVPGFSYLNPPGNDCHTSIAHIGFEPLIIYLRERNLFGGIRYLF